MSDEEKGCCGRLLDRLCCGGSVTKKFASCLTCNSCFKRSKEDEYNSDDEKGEESDKIVDLREKGKTDNKDLCRIKKKGRRCRDCPVLILFFVFILGLVYVTFHGFYYGDPTRLYYPTDYMGRVCGKDNSNMPPYFLKLPNNTDCIAAENNPKNKEAAQRCEAAVAPYKIDLSASGYLWFMSVFDPINYGGICVSYCPGSVKDARKCPPELIQNDTTIWDVSIGYPYCLGRRSDSGLLYPVTEEENTVQALVKYTSVINRCLPVPFSLNGTKTKSKVADALGTATGMASSLWGDVMRSWKVIILATLFTLLISFIFLTFIRCFTGIVVWTTIIVTFLGLAGLGIFMVIEGWAKKVELETKQLSTTLPQIVFYVGIGLLVLSSIYAIVAFFFLCRIRKAIGIIEAAAQSLSSMPQIILLPVVLGVFYIAFLTYWIFVAVYLWAAGTPTIDNSMAVRYKLDIASQVIFAYHVFALLWVTNMFIAFEYVVVAGSVGSWYWRKDKRFSLNEPVLKAVGRTLLYHMGSIAMGSLIVSIIEFIRLLFERAQRDLTNKVKDDKIVKGCVWFVRGFLFVFETVIKYINNHAYIQIALYGNSFFAAARNAFLLITRNVLQIGTVDIMTWIILFVGKFAIAILSALFAYGLTRSPVFVDSYDSSSSSFMVALIVFIIGFGLASLFMTILSCAIDTVLQCFMIDWEMHVGGENGGEPQYGTATLRHFIKEAKVVTGCADRFNCHVCICCTCDCMGAGNEGAPSDLISQSSAKDQSVNNE